MTIRELLTCFCTRGRDTQRGVSMKEVRFHTIEFMSAEADKGCRYENTYYQ